MVKTSSVIAASKEQVSSDLAEESVILDLKSGQYYSLDAVGARIWKLIQQPKCVHEIHACLVSEYEVEPSECEQDLLQLLTQLEEKGLIEVKNAGVA